MRTVCGGGAAEIERGSWQAGADAAARLARQMLRPVEFAAASAAAGTRRRPVPGCRRWRGSGSSGGGDGTAMRQVIKLRRGMRGREQQRRRHGGHVSLLVRMVLMRMVLVRVLEAARRLGQQAGRVDRYRAAADLRARVQRRSQLRLLMLMMMVLLLVMMLMLLLVLRLLLLLTLKLRCGLALFASERLHRVRLLLEVIRRGRLSCEVRFLD